LSFRQGQDMVPALELIAVLYAVEKDTGIEL
jgi:hypothetical protein